MLFLFLGAALLNVYAAGLVVARAVVYRTPLYRPMLWNIFLSITPILVLVAGSAASLALLYLWTPAGYAVALLFGLVWLLLLPNSSYLITELNQTHRSEDDPVPLWYDIILMITLAMSGVANTVVNVFIVHTIYSAIWLDTDVSAFVRPGVLVAVAGVMLLLGLGMYLGRYLRLNSWDVKHPLQFAHKLVKHFRSPANIWACFGFTLTYALFLCLIYVLMVGPIIQGMHSLEIAISPQR